jgi:hypothetical protein
VAALIACAIKRNNETRASIDVKEFEFDQVRDLTDPRLLPGALKYGGVMGLRRLCAKR